MGPRGVRAVAGRPAWPTLLAQLKADGARAGAGVCEVFVCGPPALGRDVAAAAAAAGLPASVEPY